MRLRLILLIYNIIPKYFIYFVLFFCHVMRPSFFSVLLFTIVDLTWDTTGGKKTYSLKYFNDNNNVYYSVYIPSIL